MGVGPIVCAAVFVCWYRQPVSTRINGSLLITMLLFVPSFYLSIRGVSDEELAKISANRSTPYYIVNVVLRKESTLIVVALILAA